MNPNIEVILNGLSKVHLSGNQVTEILNNPKEFPTELVEKLSIKTALKYWNGEMEFKDGNYIMNNIYSFWTSNEYYFKNFKLSDISWECFNAFDSGEYYRKEDAKNIDPAEKYTKPLIENLLRKRKLII
ncbi:hypothetical protein [Polaribacter sp. L3A8]|uniref:hypothetical protein n=1 Tax=Polaribacter sp. L3A8 TaxID=2686361 RepID=UPI00131AD340|nr:hypothetical protein [Polaribacter sp. L3A8]